MTGMARRPLESDPRNEDASDEHCALFVDDDAQILRGLERMLFTCDTDWSFDFANGGEEALEMLEEQDYQVIVSDMRMPGIDGAALLQRVAATYPDTVRIALSGHTELSAALRSIPVAHQFLSKPCHPKDILELLGRSLEMRELVREEGIRSAVGGMDSLPPRPELYSKIVDKLADPSSCVVDIAEIIESDIALATRVLRAANNAYFNRGRAIATPRHAVSFLGPSVVRDLTLSMEASRAFSSVPAEELDRISSHSMRVAAIAEEIAPANLKEVAFTAGLVHDVGELVLLSQGLDQQALHGKVGAYLLGLWGLPYPVLEAVAFHEDQSRVRGLDILGAVVIAEAVVNGRELDATLLGRTGLGDAYAQAKAIAGEG